MLFGLAFGEFIAASTLVYILCVAAFNAGYYAKIGGHFVELFSFADMLGANVPIFQYFLSIFTIYGTLTLPLAWATSRYGPFIKSHIDRHFLITHSSWRLFYAGFIFLLAIFILLNGIIADLPFQSFTLEITPYALFQGLLFYFYWVGFKADIVSSKVVILMFVITVVYFAQSSGRIWLEYEIKSDNVQSLLTTDSRCLERILLRSSTTGYLLYDPSTKQFEFRDHSSIKTIFGKNVCV